MGLIEGILGLLFGSACSGSSGNKSLDQIYREEVAFSNASSNNILRRHLQNISPECSSQVYLVEQCIKRAEEYAQRRNGSFVMDKDVEVKYRELLEEYRRQSAVKEKLKQAMDERRKQQEIEMLA